MRQQKRERTLRELRRMADWTQAKTSRATGVDRALLSQIETGEIKPNAATVAKIRRVLIQAIAKRASRIVRVLNDATISQDERKTIGRLRTESRNLETA